MKVNVIAATLFAAFSAGVFAEQAHDDDKVIAPKAFPTGFPTGLPTKLPFPKPTKLPFPIPGKPGKPGKPTQVPGAPMPTGGLPKSKGKGHGAAAALPPIHHTDGGASSGFATKTKRAEAAEPSEKPEKPTGKPAKPSGKPAKPEVSEKPKGKPHGKHHGGGKNHGTGALPRPTKAPGGKPKNVRDFANFDAQR